MQAISTSKQARSIKVIIRTPAWVQGCDRSLLLNACMQKELSSMLPGAPEHRGMVPTGGMQLAGKLHRRRPRAREWPPQAGPCRGEGRLPDQTPQNHDRRNVAYA